jgi:hypothetical protein
MPVIRRIYVSMPSDRWLAPNQNDLKWGIVEEIEQLGYTPEIFTDLRAGLDWLPDKPGARSMCCVEKRRRLAFSNAASGSRPRAKLLIARAR